MTVNPITRHTAIADSEWIVTVHLEVGGKKLPSSSLELRYADSILSKAPKSVGELIGCGMAEHAAKQARLLGHKPNKAKAPAKRAPRRR